MIQPRHGGKIRSMVSQLWHPWHSRRGNYLLWGAVLCTIGHSSASLTSNHLMPAASPKSRHDHPHWETLKYNDNMVTILVSFLDPIYCFIVQDSQFTFNFLYNHFPQLHLCLYWLFDLCGRPFPPLFNWIISFSSFNNQHIYCNCLSVYQSLCEILVVRVWTLFISVWCLKHTLVAWHTPGA